VVKHLIAIQNKPGQNNDTDTACTSWRLWWVYSGSPDQGWPICCTRGRYMRPSVAWI